MITEERRIPAYPLDYLPLTYHYPLHDIKIDTEGHEVEVVRGAIQTIRRWRPRILVEIHGAENGDQLAALLLFEHYKVHQLIRHPHYEPDSPAFHQHYWMWFWPEEAT
jgi:hypothetical protein